MKWRYLLGLVWLTFILVTFLKAAPRWAYSEAAFKAAVFGAVFGGLAIWCWRHERRRAAFLLGAWAVCILASFSVAQDDAQREERQFNSMSSTQHLNAAKEAWNARGTYYPEDIFKAYVKPHLDAVHESAEKLAFEESVTADIGVHKIEQEEQAKKQAEDRQTTTKQKYYATIYSVRPSRVSVFEEPQDCEWGTAPLGNKLCHYEKSVTAVKDDAGRNTDVVVFWRKQEGD
jgi:hypothetical protein